MTFIIPSLQVGGALYQLDGYYLPFVVLGSALFTCAILTLCVLPHHPVQTDRNENQGSMLKVLKIPGVLVSTFGICATSASIGFIAATLEPHLRQFDLSAVMIGIMFIINGGVYALIAPFVGILVDRCKSPKIASIAGSFCIIIGFSLVGEFLFESIKNLFQNLFLRSSNLRSIQINNSTSRRWPHVPRNGNRFAFGFDVFRCSQDGNR